MIVISALSKLSNISPIAARSLVTFSDYFSLQEPLSFFGDYVNYFCLKLSRGTTIASKIDHDVFDSNQWLKDCFFCCKK